MLRAAMIIQAHVMGYMARYELLNTSKYPRRCLKLTTGDSLTNFCCHRVQEALQEAAAVHRGHSEELPGFLLEEEVLAPSLGGAHLPETGARPAGPPGVQPAAGGEEEEGGRGAPQEDAGGDGEVG